MRAATRPMQSEPTARRRSLLLSDGGPHDPDAYQERDGIEDTRNALRQARRQGLRPFCMTIDRQAHACRMGSAGIISPSSVSRRSGPGA